MSTISIPVTPGQAVKFIETSPAALYERLGDSLVVTDGENIITYTDFFAQGQDCPLPVVVLPDGTEIDGKEFLQALNSDMDLSTAAGPGSSAPGSGGAGDYAGDPGSLAGGVERLGDTESMYWNRSTNAPEENAFVTNVAAYAPGASSALPPLGPGGESSVTPPPTDPGEGGPIIPPITPPVIPPLPAGPDGPYVRAVLYNPGNSTDPVGVPVFFDDGSGLALLDRSDIHFEGSTLYGRYVVTFSAPEGWSDSWVDVGFNSSTGRLEFRLTAEGIAEMQQLGLDGKNLVNFITINVTDIYWDASYEYSVELVATDDPHFDSVAHDNAFTHGDKMENIGEYHQGKGESDAYFINASARNDEIILNDTVLGGSQIHASVSGNPALMADDYNTIKLNEGVLSAESGKFTHITSADGTLTAQKSVAATQNNAGNTIDMGKGSVGIATTDGHGVAASQGENCISGATITVTSNKTGVLADNGKNTISSEDGAIAIKGRSSALLAENTGENYVFGKDITFTANGSSAVRATTNGQNTIVGKDGVVSGSGYSGLMADGGTNSVSVENGGISFHGTLRREEGGAAAINGGKNIVEATGNTTVSMTGDNYGLYAKGGSNTITAEDGAMTIKGGYGGGVYADTGGSNRVEGSDMTISSSMNGVTSINGGKNYIDGGEDGNVSITGNVYFGVEAEGAGSEVYVHGKEVNIKSTYGIGVDAGGLVDVRGEIVNLTASTAITIDNWMNGTINVEADKELNVRLTNANQSSAAVMTLGGTTTLKSGGDVNINVDKGTYQTAGINTWSGGTTNVTAENNININVHAEEEKNNVAIALSQQKGHSLPLSNDFKEFPCPPSRMPKWT